MQICGAALGGGAHMALASPSSRVTYGAERDGVRALHDDRDLQRPLRAHATLRVARAVLPFEDIRREAAAAACDQIEAPAAVDRLHRDERAGSSLVLRIGRLTDGRRARATRAAPEPAVTDPRPPIDGAVGSLEGSPSTSSTGPHAASSRHTDATTRMRSQLYPSVSFRETSRPRQGLCDRTCAAHRRSSRANTDA